MTHAFRFAAPLVALALACAGCTEPTALPGDSDNPAHKEEGQPVTSLAAIEGFWLVERFGDFEPGWRNDTPWRRAFVQIGRDGLTYNIGCNQSGNPASLGKDSILRDTGNGERIQTLMGCDEERTARDEQFYAFFGTNPTVSRIGPDRVRLSGPAGDLVLIEPEAWRRDNAPELGEITGRWVPQMVTRHEGWGYSGIGLERPGVLTIAADAIAWDGCGGMTARGSWTADARFVAQGPVAANCRYKDDGAIAIERMLARQPAAIRTGADRIVLTADDVSIALQSERSVLNPPAEPPHAAPAAPPPAPPPSRR